ncbi:MAG: tetratricopeptide repeat protein [Anaerolineae bacterium]|nr:tetratricopeptide repeat protein [Anaerolineae bacterium]MDQ7035469.1 tetratricopeptide repeat protein [Anaerolineae bacterium]
MNLLPKRPPIPVLPSLIFTGFIIGFIAVRTNFWVGLLLFFAVIILPLALLLYVYYLGAALAIRGQFHDAIDHYSRLLNLPINKVMIYVRRAALKNAVGDIDGAIADYSAAMKHLPKEDPTLYALRSGLYLGKREFELALADSNRLLELLPESQIGYANRAAARMFLGDAEGAIADCNIGLEKQSSPSGKALLYNNRGTAYRITGEYTEAMANYNLAMSMSLSAPEKKMIHPSITTNQGIVYYVQQDFDNARAYFQQAVNTSPTFNKALVSLAAARYKLGQLADAQKLWLDVLKDEPRYRDSQFLLKDLNLPIEMMSDVTALIESMTA